MAGTEDCVYTVAAKVVETVQVSFAQFETAGGGPSRDGVWPVLARIARTDLRQALFIVSTALASDNCPINYFIREKEENMLRRILESVLFLGMLTSLASGQEEQLRIFRLKHADCKAIHEILDDLSQGELVASKDERTNSLILMAKPETIDGIADLISALDVAVEEGRDRHAEEDEEQEEREREEREHDEEMWEREELEWAVARRRAGMQVEFLERQMEMKKAEAELELESLKLELASAENRLAFRERELEQVKAEIHDGQRQKTDEYGTMVDIEDARRTIELVKRRIEFQAAHVIPMKVLEAEMQLAEAHAELRHFEIEDEEEEEEFEARDDDDDDDEAEREEEREEVERRRASAGVDRANAVVQNRTAATVDTNSETPQVFSGPQPGERLAPFEAKVIFGENAGDTAMLMADETPKLLVFVHQITRPSVGLARALTQYAAKKPELETQLVFLADDPTEMEAWMQRARHALPKGVQPMISTDGIDGPGIYGLNREVSVTALVGRNGKVTENFALVQPSINVDMPKIGAAIASVLGEEKAPTLEEMGFSGRRMQRGRPQMSAEQQAQDGKYRQKMGPVIQKGASPDQVLAAAREVEAYAVAHPWFRARVAKAANLIVNGGKLENYGTSEAQEFLKKWAVEMAEE